MDESAPIVSQETQFSVLNFSRESLEHLPAFISSTGFSCLTPLWGVVPPRSRLWYWMQIHASFATRNQLSSTSDWTVKMWPLSQAYGMKGKKGNIQYPSLSGLSVACSKVSVWWVLLGSCPLNEPKLEEKEDYNMKELQTWSQTGRKNGSWSSLQIPSGRPINVIWFVGLHYICCSLVAGANLGYTVPWYLWYPVFVLIEIIETCDYLVKKATRLSTPIWYCDLKQL